MRSNYSNSKKKKKKKKMLFIIKLREKKKEVFSWRGEGMCEGGAFLEIKKTMGIFRKGNKINKQINE